MYLLFTTPSCQKCVEAKIKLQEKGLIFKEINVVESEKNMELAKKYNIVMGGTIVDDKTGEIIEL